MKYSNNVLRIERKYASLFFLAIFFGIGLLITGVLNTQIVKNKQAIQSKAQGPIQEPQCTNLGGECQTGKLNAIGKPCSLSNGTPGIVKYNFCPIQEGDIRCCVPTNQNNSHASMTVTLQGIGPSANVQNPVVQGTIKIYDSTKPITALADYTAQDNLTYDTKSGNFINNNFNLGPVSVGSYHMVLQINKYLDQELVNAKDMSNVFALGTVDAAEVSPVTMQAGDIAPSPNGDNFVNIIDYNALIGCMPGAPASACLNKKFADLNDDGKVDQTDLDILLSNFGESGFAFQTDQFSCSPDPTCGTGQGTLQLCSLICKKKTQRG